MPARLTPQRASDILAAIEARPEGITLTELAAGLTDAPDLPLLSAWCERLAGSKRFTIETVGDRVRYRVMAPPAAAPIAPVVPAREPVAAPAVVVSDNKTSAPAVDPDALLRRAVIEYVNCGITLNVAPMMLRDGALDEGLTGAEVDRFVDRTMAVLNALTSEQAVSLYDIKATAYASWREKCDWAAGRTPRTLPPTPPPTSGPVPDPRTDKASTRNSKQRPSVEDTKSVPPEERSEAITPAHRDAVSPNKKPGFAEILRKRVADIGLTQLMILIGAVAGTVTAYVRNRPGIAATIVGLTGAAAGGWFFTAQRGEAARDATNPQSAGGKEGVTSNAGDSGLHLTRKTLLIAASTILVAALLGGATYAYLSHEPSVDVAALRDHLATSVTARGGRLAEVQITSSVRTGTAWRITYEAQCVTTVSLYQRLEPVPYLRAHFADEMAAIDAAKALLAGPNGDALRALLGESFAPASGGASKELGVKSNARVPLAVGSVPTHSQLPISNSFAALNSAVALTTATAPGTWSVSTGQLTAFLSDGAWHFDGEPLKIDRFVGERRPAGDLVFAVDEPADAARLKTLVAEQAAQAAQVLTAAKRLAAEQEQQQQQRLATLAGLLEPRTLFTGTAAGVGTAPPTIALEITSRDATTVTAALHTDVGWTEARAYRGEWAPATVGQGLVLTLRTTRADQLDGAGPLLDENADRTITLTLHPDGTAIAMPGGWELRRVAPADAGPLKAAFSRAIVPALAATKAGLVYHGAVSAAGGAASETLVLRFTAQDPTGTRLEASLQSTTMAGWSRPFHGQILDNSHRASGTPVRLQSSESERVLQAPTGSMLGVPKPVALTLRVDDGQLTGEGGGFTYAFATGDAATNNGGAAAPNNSGAASAARLLPPFPPAKGAYVLSDDGRWERLPSNNARKTQSLVQMLNDFFARAKQIEAGLEGVTLPPPKDVTADLMIDGFEPVPAVNGHEVIVIYNGPLVMNARLVNQHPELALEPPMEVAPAWTTDNGSRTTPLVSPVKGLHTFGPLRVPSKLERPTVDITQWRCSIDLSKRYYAVIAGDNVYEFLVR